MACSGYRTAYEREAEYDKKFKNELFFFCGHCGAHFKAWPNCPEGEWSRGGITCPCCGMDDIFRDGKKKK